MLMTGASSIRDVIAFPKVQNASDLMMNCPDVVDEKLEEALAIDGPVICEVFVTLDQNFEPKSAAKRLPDGTLVSPPLEDLSPFLPDEEMDRIMLIPRIKK